MQDRPWADFRKVLCIRADNMGDVLMITPALRALGAAYPDMEITLLTSRAGALVAHLVPEVAKVIELDAPWAKNDSSLTPADLKEAAKNLARKKFDASIIFTSYSQSALPASMLCYLAGITEVLAYSRENPYKLISRWIPDPEPLELLRHEVERQLDLVAEVGAADPPDLSLSLEVPKVAITSARKKLAARGLDADSPWLALHAGASEQKRRYSSKDYAEAARQLQGEGWQVVLTGSAEEKESINKLADAIGGEVINTAGELDVAELAALIQLAPVLVSNNTGPVHIASAVGTPCVVLYAQTNPQHTPWQTPSRVLYFAVEPGLQSRNRLLRSFPGPDQPQASPGAIVAAVRELAQKEALWPK